MRAEHAKVKKIEARPIPKDKALATIRPAPKGKELATMSPSPAAVVEKPSQTSRPEVWVK
jgi:hypothetical protein